MYPNSKVVISWDYWDDENDLSQRKPTLLIIPERRGFPKVSIGLSYIYKAWVVETEGGIRFHPNISLLEVLLHTKDPKKLHRVEAYGFNMQTMKAFTKLDRSIQKYISRSSTERAKVLELRPESITKEMYTIEHYSQLESRMLKLLPTSSGSICCTVMNGDKKNKLMSKAFSYAIYKYGVSERADRFIVRLFNQISLGLDDEHRKPSI